LTTATVLEFALISPPSPDVVALFYHITCKNSGISLKKQPLNFSNQLPITFSMPCLMALDKTQETPEVCLLDIISSVLYISAEQKLWAGTNLQL